MLAVSTTVGVVHCVHCYTTHANILLTLGLGGVKLITGLEEGFLPTSSPSYHSNGGSALGVEGLQLAGWQLNYGLTHVMGDKRSMST